MEIHSDEETAVIADHEDRLQKLAWNWADKGRLVSFVFALAERVDTLYAYNALQAQGLRDFATKAPRATAYTLQRLLDEEGWDYEPDDVIIIATEFASLLVDENYDLPWLTDEVLDHAQSNAVKIIARWHEAADSVASER